MFASINVPTLLSRLKKILIASFYKLDTDLIAVKVVAVFHVAEKKSIPRKQLDS